MWRETKLTTDVTGKGVASASSQGIEFILGSKGLWAGARERAAFEGLRYLAEDDVLGV